MERDQHAQALWTCPRSFLVWLYMTVISFICADSSLSAG
jgi:hypothetical protein